MPLVVNSATNLENAIQRAGMILGDVVAHLQDDPAPSNASDTNESNLPTTPVLLTSAMDPTRGNPELNGPETTTLLLSRVRDNLSITQN